MTDVARWSLSSSGQVVFLEAWEPLKHFLGTLELVYSYVDNIRRLYS